jgi:RNA polymerase sigma-70 factor, ECF subfamily
VGEADRAADLDLAKRMLAGEEDAFDTFGERYFKALYRFAAARLDGDRDLSREIVQTTVAKALARLRTYRGEASLLTWLCSCCRNEILMHLRHRRAAPADRELPEEVEPAVGSFVHRPRDPEAALLRQEKADLVHVALDGLPAHYSQALEWKYLECLPVEEIAARMELRPKAAESLLARARQAFRSSYQGLWNAGRKEKEADHG